MEILAHFLKTLRTNAYRTAVIAVGALLMLLGSLPAKASTQDTIEAVYVFNFAKLVTWPDSSGPITIGVIGNSSAGDAVTAIVNGRSANGRSITVKSIGVGDAKNCQIVFVCGDGGVPNTDGCPVLTIGEESGFAANGGCLDFVVDEDTVHFEVNVSALKHAHLTADPKLAELGKVVG